VPIGTIDQQAKDGIVRAFREEYDNGVSGAAATINWRNAQKQRITLSAACVLAFTAPPGVGNFMLKIIQGGIGSYTITWPGTVWWPGGTAPSLSTAVGRVDIVAFYYDGTNYLGMFTGDFR
jgi:hypothetical protein